MPTLYYIERERERKQKQTAGVSESLTQWAPNISIPFLFNVVFNTKCLIADYSLFQCLLGITVSVHNRKPYYYTYSVIQNHQTHSLADSQEFRIHFSPLFIRSFIIKQWNASQQNWKRNETESGYKKISQKHTSAQCQTCWIWNNGSVQNSILT